MVQLQICLNFFSDSLLWIKPPPMFGTKENRGEERRYTFQLPPLAPLPYLPSSKHKVIIGKIQELKLEHDQPSEVDV